MTTADRNGPTGADGKVTPETLDLRARPQPVTRINRKVLIGRRCRWCRAHGS